MSKIGKQPITLPTGVNLTINEHEVVVKGPKGELTAPLFSGIKVQIKDGNLVQVSRENDQKQTKSYHGLVRSLLNNYVQGVSQGFKKVLKMVGTGYRVNKKGNGLELSVGFSHSVVVEPLAGVQLDVTGTDLITVSGIDKQIVGQMAANIRSIRKPEPYQGKGIRYEGEVVKIKPGKTASEK